jgi:hypothetical protein
MATMAENAWGRKFMPEWIECMKPLYNNKTLYVSKGNHELYTWVGVAIDKTHQTEFQNYFSYLPGNGASGYERLDYSFVYGNSYFLVFDSFYCWQSGFSNSSNWNYGDITSTQLDWLSSQVKTTEANNAVHKFAISHAPVYSDEGDKEFDNMKTVWQMIDDNKFDIFYGAHEHLYSRHTMDSSMSQNYKNNVVQIVSGCGGAQPDSVKDIKVNMQSWNVKLWMHFIVVEVNGNTVTSKAYRVYSDSSDTYYMDEFPFDVVTVTKGI